MTQIDFYHLQKQTLEAVLPKLLEKAYGTGKKIKVKIGNPERVEFINSILWTYEEESFSWNEIQDAVGKAAYFADVCIFIATRLKFDVPDVVSLLSIVASGILTFVNGGDSTSGIIIKYKITVREQFIPFPEHWAYYDTIRTPVSYRFY